MYVSKSILFWEIIIFSVACKFLGVYQMLARVILSEIPKANKAFFLNLVSWDFIEISRIHNV